MKELDWCTKTNWSVTAFIDLAASSPRQLVSKLMYSGHKGMMGCCLLKAAEAPSLHYERAAGVKTERLSSCSWLDWGWDIPVNQNTSMQRGGMMGKRETPSFCFKKTSTTLSIVKCFIVSF